MSWGLEASGSQSLLGIPRHLVVLISVSDICPVMVQTSS